MVINRIHLGPVVFARVLAASIAARHSVPPASGGCPGVKHREVGDRNTTTTRSNRRQLPQAPGGRPIRVRSTAETT
jgi:hypothetical protein